MITFAKAQLASFFASAVDYFFTIFCVEILGFWYVAGSCVGTIIGGITNFSMGRHWVFKATDKQKHMQLLRYLLVWTGYLVLATSGVYMLTHFSGINYIFSKISVTLFLALAYNYPLQKKFVFR